MKNFKMYVNIGYILAIISILIGAVDKIAKFRIFHLDPVSYLRFSAYCLLFIISLALVELVLGKKE